MHRSPTFRFATVTICLLLCSQTALARQWLTGTQFKKALARPVGVTWADTPIREALNSLSDAQHVAIFLDRRVDPSMPISATGGLAPFEQTLRDALRPYKLSVGFVGPVIYVGPKQTAARIATLAELRNEKAAKLPIALRKPFLQRLKLEWEELSEPSAIVAGLGERANLEFGNLTVIPHDVWRASELPPLTLSESLTLVLAGFSMNFTIDGEGDEQQFMVTRFPIGVSIERTYPLGRAPETRLAEIKQELPQAFVEKKGARVVVRSLLEDHWRLADMWSKKGASTSNGNSKSTQVYTLKVENKPVGRVIEILANQIGWSVNFAAGCETSLDKRVSFSVKDASAAELLSAAAEAASLVAEVSGTTVEVSPETGP
jgi:hypothetical protein